MAQEIKQYLEDEYLNDELKQYIDMRESLKENLYPDFLLKMNFREELSTPDVAKHLGKNDSTLRNYLRHETLIHYIQPLRNGRFYRLNLDGVFKLHMIFLYLEQEGKTIPDLEILLGLKNQVYDERNSGSSSSALSTNTSSEDLNAVKNSVMYMHYQMMRMEDEFKLRDLQNQKMLLQSDMQSIETEIKYHQSRKENKRLERRQQDLLSYALQKTVKRDSGGILSIFKKQDVDVNAALQESIDEVSKNTYTEADEHKKEISSLESRKEELQVKIKELEEEIATQKIDLDEKRKFLEDEKEKLSLLPTTNTEDKNQHS